MSEAHDRVERLAGAIYGTIVVAGVLATTEGDDNPDALETALYALATVFVFYLAHAWAQTLGRRLVGVGAPKGALRHSLARDWPLVQSALPPLGAMAIAALFELDDPFAHDPQAVPAGPDELAARLEHGARLEGRFRDLTVQEAVARLAERGVPAAEVRGLGQLFADRQAGANGLVQTVEQRHGPVTLLGSVFKVDGRSEPARRGAPALDEHRRELLG